MTSAPRLHAELYAAVHRGQAGDLAHYRNVAAGSERILELGCGWGRVAIDLARAGHTVTGVDHDAALLDLARRALSEETPEVRERVSWVQSDMTTLALQQRFERVLIPYNTLLCLLSPAKVERCLRVAARHLCRDGILSFDVYCADALHLEEQDDVDDLYEPVVELTLHGRRYRVFERSEWRRAEQRLDTHYLFVDAAGDGIETCIAQRYLLQSEIEPMLETCGFRLMTLHGGFEGQPVDIEGDALVVVARKR